MKYSHLKFILCFFLFLGCSREKSAEELLAQAGESYEKRDYLEARKFLGEALKLKPTDKEIVFQMGQAYMASNMFDSAFAHLSRADKLNPNDRRINELLHQASVESKHWNAAIGALLVLATTGDPIEKYYRQIGEYALNDSAGQIAFYYYGMLIELEPDSINHYLHQAEGGVLEGEPQNAINVLKTALKKFGDQPPLLGALGRLYLSVGNFNESEKTYRLLVAKEENTFNQLQLATTLSLQKERAKKREAYELFQMLRGEAININRVDSIIRALEYELSLPK